ncbi:TetR/AcrR family transcriptional regulator [Rhodococcus erythropolis]|uniref:TetR/AcrR family transcriptional regulator n=1 Tax=Rhodococcus erythropolis TaxID=1833 RepID=UPI0022279C5E|nr:TetR/AcrR family transcriptional regulator [Rhodococcus erythropolis]MCW2295428.1 AcrR family transcriptional regulator [Rhodococcus erythropolis]
MRRGGTTAGRSADADKDSAPAAVNGAKAARTRERVLEATAIVLNREGYAGTKLGDISELAELQAPAIYYHFPSRDAVIEEAIAMGQRATIEYVSQTLGRIASGATPIERILAAASAHLTVTLKWSDYSSASTRCFAQLPLDMQERLGELRTDYGAIWKTLFEEASTAGELAVELDVISAMMLTLGALNWATEWWDASRGDLDALLSTTRRYILNALTASPSSKEST